MRSDSHDKNELCKFLPMSPVVTGRTLDGVLPACLPANTTGELHCSVSEKIKS